jgi:hypothetical protein
MVAVHNLKGEIIQLILSGRGGGRERVQITVDAVPLKKIMDFL